MNLFYSVIIPFYGDATVLEKTLHSVDNTRYPNKEIIVVNDASDCNLDLMGDKYECRLIDLQKRSGPSLARNIGAKTASFEYLIFLDADIIIPKNCFTMLNIFLKGVAKTTVLNVGISTHCPYDNFFSQYSNMLFRYSVLKKSSKTVFSFFCVITKELFRETEGFDERNLLPYADDIILGWRLNRIGCNFKLFEQIEVQHYKKVNVFKFITYHFWHSYYLAKFFVICGEGLKTVVLTNKKEGIGTVIAVSIFLIFLYLGIFNLHITSAIFLATVLGINAFFLKFLFREKNLVFAFKSFWLIIFQYSIYLIGIVAGGLKGFLNRWKFSITNRT